jgi:MFS family permease
MVGPQRLLRDGERALVAAGLGIGTVWTNSDALVGELADSRQMGASMGAAQSFKEFGDMVGPVLIGLLTQFFGIRTGFVTCGMLALVFLVPLARSRAFAQAVRNPSQTEPFEP